LVAQSAVNLAESQNGGHLVMAVEGTGMKSVIVTGGSGKAGRAAIRELLKHGYQVMNVDTAAPAEQLCHFMA
jgi:ribosomal protein S11